MTIRIKKESNSAYSRTISNANYRAVNFNGNYPYKVRFVDKTNKIDTFVYDHSISIEVPVAATIFQFKVEVYDNSNNTLLATLTPGLQASNVHKYETRTSRPSAYKLKIISTKYPSVDYYTKITVKDTNSNTQLYSGYNISHEFVFTPSWGEHIMLGATVDDVLKKVNHAPFEIYHTHNVGGTENDYRIEIYCKHYDLYTVGSSSPSLWDTGRLDWEPNGVVTSTTIPELYMSLNDDDGTVPDLTLDVITGSPYAYCKVSYISSGITLSNQNTTHTLNAKNSSGFITGYVETLSMDFPDPSSTGEYFSLGADTIPFYSIHFSSKKTLSRYYNTGSYSHYPYVFFDGTYFDIQIGKLLTSISDSTVRVFHVTGFNLNTIGSKSYWYQADNVFNPYGYINASDHIATISEDTESLSGRIYGQVLTGGSGNWTAKIYNDSSVDIRCQYYSKKTKENETTFDKTITVKNNSNSGNITLQDQAWYDDRWFRVQAIGWYSTVGASFKSCYGAVKKIPDDNSKGYLY